MAEKSGTYNLSLSPGRPKVGIRYMHRARVDQPVRLSVNPINWVAKPPISNGGPTQLGVGSYQYTGVLRGEVFATNDPDLSQEWFLLSRNDEDAYFIATDSTGNRVWSVEGPGAPIKITNFTGERNQLFRFASVQKSGMKKHFAGVRLVS